MTDEDSNRKKVTRRDTLKHGGAVVTGGVLAGCTGQSDPETTTRTGSSYEACIEPAGCVPFEEVPETYLVYNGGWADMAFALGQREGFLTAGNMIPGFFFEPFDLDVPPQDELPALANWDGGGWDKEIFYELDPDVILMDPNYLHGTGWDDDWDESDTQEIQENVAPLFGNNCRRRRDFHDYKLYTLYEAFDRLADLFQERERYEAFATLHDEMLTEVQSRLPPEDERPEVGLINGGSNPSKGKFYPLHTRDEGYEMKPYRDLDVKSAFSKELEDSGTIDYERLLDVDPEIIIVHWGIGTTGDEGRGAGNTGGSGFAPDIFYEQYVAPMEEDPVGSQLTAVQNGTVYPVAYGEQGPIVNLLQTEMKAQQLYPEEFGAFDPERFPEVPEENRLFDRQRVRDIIDGNI